MAYGLSLTLRAIQPRDRVRRAIAPSSRRPPKLRPHTRVGPERAPARRTPRRGMARPVATAAVERAVWQTTQRRPWTVKAERRAANRRARRSRKANRR